MCDYEDYRLDEDDNYLFEEEKELEKIISTLEEIEDNYDTLKHRIVVTQIVVIVLIVTLLNMFFNSITVY